MGYAEDSLTEEVHKDENPLIAELKAKRLRGNIGADNVKFDVELGLLPPPKARLRGIGKPDDEGVDEAAPASLDGFDVAVVPYSVRYLKVEELRGPKGHAGDVSGVMSLLWRSIDDDTPYETVVKRAHTLHIPVEFFDAESAKKIRPFFQVKTQVIRTFEHSRL